MDFKLTTVAVFPVGTTVGAYPASARREGAAPEGSAVDEQTMGATGLTFTGLDPDTRYVAYAKVGDRHRYVSFSTVVPRGYKGVVVHGDDADAARPAGFASIEWHGSVEPNNAENDDTWIDTSEE